MSRPRVLFVGVEFPYPITNGVTIKSWNLASRLGRIADVTLVNLTMPGVQATAEAQAHVRARVSRVIDVPQGPRNAVRAAMRLRPPFVSRYDTPDARRIIGQLTSSETWDVIHLDALGSGALLHAIARRPRVLVSSPNDVYGLMVERREANGGALARGAAWLNAALVRRFERRLYAACDQVHFVSEVDCEYAREHYPRATVHRIPIGTEVQPDLGVAEDPRAIVFVANMLEGHGTSIERFVSETLPLIRARVPDAKLWLVGANPPESLRKRAEMDPGLTVTGWVDDLGPWIQGAALALSINPLPGGMQNKVMGPMGAGKAVVGLAPNFVSIEGAEEGVHYVTAVTPEDFAGRISALLEQPERRRRIGAAAQALVRERYTWDGVVERYRKLVLDPLAGS